jgi:hypothetical protein
MPLSHELFLVGLHTGRLIRMLNPITIRTTFSIIPTTLTKSSAIDSTEVTYAAIWRQRQAYLRPVKQIDPVRLNQLLGIETQKQRLIDNTERFLAAQPVYRQPVQINNDWPRLKNDGYRLFAARSSSNNRSARVLPCFGTA